MICTVKNIPLNRWTVGAVTLILLVFGSDFVAPILKVIGILTANHVPAI